MRFMTIHGRLGDDAMVKSINWTNEQHFAWRLENLKGAIQLADLTIKSLLLVNGGAAAGLLTFYGNIADKHPTHPAVDANQLSNVMFNFALGVATALASAILAYCAQRAAATTNSGKLELAFAIPAMLAACGSAAFFFVGVTQGAMALP